MRKSELKVGGEYAAGSTSTYDRFSLARVRVVDLDGERGRIGRGGDGTFRIPADTMAKIVAMIPDGR
jgi:hypothetical protein